MSNPNADSLALSIYTGFIESYFSNTESIKYIRSQRYRTLKEFRTFLTINKPVSRAWNTYKSNLPAAQQQAANIFFVRSMGNDDWWANSKELKKVLSNLKVGNESVSALTSQFQSLQVSPLTQPVNNSSNNNNNLPVYNNSGNNFSTPTPTSSIITEDLTVNNVPVPPILKSLGLFHAGPMETKDNSSTSGKTQTHSNRFTKDFIVEVTKNIEPALKAILQSKYSDRPEITAKIAEFRLAASQVGVAYVHFENYTPKQKKDAYKYAKMLLGYLYVIVQSDRISENQAKLINKLTDLIESKFISQ
jgi:hypothetical protein